MPLTLEEMKELPPQEQRALFDRIKSLRGPYKAANYSCIYGVGAPALARDLGIPLKEAKVLIEAYWERNYAVKEVVSSQVTKIAPDGKMWLYNPVSGFWISLRFQKDIFSSLNQSTGVYVFDKWVAFCKLDGVNIAFQYHDEQLDRVKIGDEVETEKKLHKAIEKVNKVVKLNVPLSVDVQFGTNYSDCH